jgi:DNA primase
MSQVDQVRAAVDIVKFIGDYVKLRKTGANYTGLCPFHSEKTPSFAVHPIKQIFHCFGCGVGGDVFKFVMLIDSLPFPEALRRVAEKVGVRIEEREGDATYDANTKLRNTLMKMHDVAARFFAAQLGATAEGRAARGYLADRGITDEMVGRFRIGYAPGDGQSLVRQFSSEEFDRDAREKSGLILVDAERQRPYDRFRRRIIFPISNDSGKVVAFAGRALGDDHPKYLNSPETAIYTKSRLLYHLDRAAQAIRKLDYAVLVEGYMDCIAVATAGIENVVASCGTSLTDGQVRLLGRYTRRVVVNYDPDSAGMAATERSLTLLLEAGFEAKVLALPGGLDPDEFIRKRGVEAYAELLRIAPTYLDYLTDRASTTHDVRTPEGKVAAVNAILPYLAKVPNPIMRTELAGRLAERLRVDGKLLREELRRAAGDKRTEVHVATPEAVEANHGVKQLLRGCLLNAEIADALLEEIVTTRVMEGLAGENIFRALLEVRKRGEDLDLNHDSGGPLNEFEKRLAIEAQFSPEGAPSLDQARGHLRKLHIERVERRRDQIQRDIEAAAQSQDFGRLKDLQAAKSETDRELRRLMRA